MKTKYCTDYPIFLCKSKKDIIIDWILYQVRANDPQMGER